MRTRHARGNGDAFEKSLNLKTRKAALRGDGSDQGWRTDGWGARRRAPTCGLRMMRTTTGVAAIGRSGAVATTSDAKAQPWSPSLAGSVLPKFTPVTDWPEYIAIMKPSADATGMNRGAMPRRNASAQATSQKPQVREKRCSPPPRSQAAIIWSQANIIKT